MQQQKKTKIKAELLSYMSKKNISQNRLATELSISGAQLSNILTNKWEKISEEMWSKLAVRFLGDQWLIIPTSNLQAVIRICTDAQNFSETMFILEETGTGKTEGIRYYADSTPSAYLILCDQMMTKKDLMREIIKALGITYDGRIREMLFVIINELKKRKKPLLIFDEIDKLSDGCLMCLKVIYDRLEYHCGIVNAGTPALEIRIKKNCIKDKIGWRELRRRFFTNIKKLRPFNTKDKVIREEVKLICEEQGIVGDNQLNYILNKAKNFGDLRNIIRNFQRLKSRQTA